MTYRQIQNYVKKQYGKSVKTSWIAHAKELSGFTIKPSARSKKGKPRVYPCPDWALPLIQEAFEKLHLVDK